MPIPFSSNPVMTLTVLFMQPVGIILKRARFQSGANSGKFREIPEPK